MTCRIIYARFHDILSMGKIDGMRVIAGDYKGMRLHSPPGRTTRPTSDRVKEALFSSIESRIVMDDARVLDLCAGTGSLGIEALSRGASRCWFVENDRKIITVLEQNLKITGSDERSHVLAMDAVKALGLLSSRKIVFDLVLIDPPYSSAIYNSLPELLLSGLIGAETLVVVEHSSRIPLPETYGCMRHQGGKVYGDTALDYFQMEER